MANKVIDVVLRLKDNMTHPLATASARMKAHANQWQRAGRDIQRVGRKMENAGKGLTRGLTAPIAAAGVASVKSAADFEKGMSDVMAIMGTSGAKAEKQRKQLEENAKAMSKNGFAADEVAEAYKYMGMAGWKAKEIMAGTEPIMKLAAATNTEVGRTSDIVTDALSAFGAKAKDTAKLTDILAKVSTSSNTNVEMLGETFKYAAPVAGAFNYSMAETAAVSGLMANAGVKASQAGTTLRSTMTNLLAPTKQASDMMEKYGLNVKEMAKMPLQKQLETLRNTYKGLEKDEKGAFAKAIAGKNAMSGFMAVMDVSDKSFKTFSKNVKDSSGATDKMFKTSMDNLTGQLKILKAEVKNAGIAFGDILMPSVKKAVGWIQKGVEWSKRLTDEQKEHIVKIAGIVAAIGPVMIVVGKLTGIVGKVVTGFSAIAKAGGLLAALSGPGAIVLGVVAAIAAAVAFAVTHWNEMKDSVKECWNAIQPVVEAIKKAFGSLFSGITDGGKKTSKKLVGFFKDTFKILAKVLGLIAPIIANVIDAVGGIIETIASVVGEVFGAIRKFIKEHEAQIEGIVKTVQDIIKIIVDVVTTVLKPVIKGVGKAIKGIIDVLGGVLDFIEGVFTGNWKQAWEGLKNIALGPIKAIDEALDGLFSKHASNILDFFGVGLSDKSVEKNQKLRKYFYDNDLMNKGYELKTNFQGKVYIADKRGEDIPLPFEDELAKLASGTNNWRGGIVQISERGGEIVDLPSGSRVYPHDESVQKAYRDGQASAVSNSVSINIPKLADKIVVREDADINKIANKLAHKLEKTSLNLGSSQMGYQYQS